MSDTTTVVLKSGKKVVHDADVFEVTKDGSLILKKRDEQPPEEPSKWWHLPIYVPSYNFPKTVHVYAAGEWKEFY